MIYHGDTEAQRFFKEKLTGMEEIKGIRNKF
jgi:hypothetical protein